MMYCVLKFELRTNVKKHPLATNEASDGKRLLRSSAATGRLFLPEPTRRLSLLGSLGCAGVGPKPYAGRSDGDTSTERLSEVVTWFVLVGFGRQRWTKSRVCNCLDVFLGATGDLRCAKGLRRSRCDCSGGATSSNGGISPLKQLTTAYKIA